MLRKALRDINRQFSDAGLPKPSQYLNSYGVRQYVNLALEALGVKDYSRVRYPVNGHEFALSVRTHPFWHLVERKEFEPHCVDHLSEVVKRGSRILDVGAGYGTYALLFSKLVGETGMVYAFEPDHVSRGVLRDNLRKNRIRNVRVDDRCVSGATGVAVLRSMMWGTGNSTILQNLPSAGPLQSVVDAVTLDEFCEENELSPDGVKIDVEGAEGLVFEGARRTIERSLPWVLLEFHGGFMSEEERLRTWERATRSAEKVIFLDGESRLHSPGDELDRMPDCPSFHIFIRH